MPAWIIDLADFFKKHDTLWIFFTSFWASIVNTIIVVAGKNGTIASAFELKNTWKDSIFLVTTSLLILSVPFSISVIPISSFIVEKHYNNEYLQRYTGFYYSLGTEKGKEKVICRSEEVTLITLPDNKIKGEFFSKKLDRKWSVTGFKHDENYVLSYTTKNTETGSGVHFLRRKNPDRYDGEWIGYDDPEKDKHMLIQQGRYVLLRNSSKYSPPCEVDVSCAQSKYKDDYLDCKKLKPLVELPHNELGRKTALPESE